MNRTTGPIRQKALTYKKADLRDPERCPELAILPIARWKLRPVRVSFRLNAFPSSDGGGRTARLPERGRRARGRDWNTSDRP
jgi:hypothetical protein